MKKLLVFLFATLFTFSCVPEGKFQTKTYFLNNTKDNITLKYYIKGNIVATFLLNIAEKKQVGFAGGRQKLIVPQAPATASDSVVLVKENKVYLLENNNTSRVPNSILFDDKRNCLNISNYEILNLETGNKHVIWTEAIFKFEDSMFL